MDNVHKNNIDKHMDKCIREVDFERLFRELIIQKMFNEHMQREIMSASPETRTRFMFDYVKTRGPDAYKKLVCSLNNTDHKELALLFDYRLFKPSDEMVDTDGEPFEMIRKAIERKDLANPSEVYHMGSRPRGLALIININKFVNDIEEPRQGSQLDVERLVSMLTQLSYNIVLKEDLSSTEFRNEIRRFARLEEHSMYDSCIVVIMTHGREGSISDTVGLKAYDGCIINSQEILEEFYGYNCKNLSGKPKMFFFQACRGKKMDHAMTPPLVQRKSVQTDGGEVYRHDYTREVDDIYLAFASAPGRLALRDEDNGAWFVQELCDVFCEYAWNTDLENMMKKVDRNIKQRYDDKYGKQTTCYNNVGFSKTLYFNPGLFDKP